LSRGALAHVDSLYVHSDSPSAVVMVTTVRAALEGAGIEVAPVAAPR
jgi:lactam utilization protein B